MNNCEECRAQVSGMGLHDYCAECHKTLCERCMAAGCCGNVPAESGTEADYGDVEEDEDQS